MNETKKLGQKEYKDTNIISDKGEFQFLFKFNEDGSILGYNGLSEFVLKNAINDSRFYRTMLSCIDTELEYELRDILRDNIKNKTLHKRYEINLSFRLSEIDIISEQPENKQPT